MNEDNSDQDMKFCDRFQRNVIENAGFVNEIVWSGEVSFKLSSTVDRLIAFTGPLKIRTLTL